MSFGVFRMRFSSSIHLPTKFMMSSFSIAEYYSIVEMGHIFCIQFLAIINKAAMNIIPLKLVASQGCPLSLYLFNIALEVLPRAIGQQKKIKEIQIGKEQLKVSLFKDNIIVYIRDPQNSTTELLQLKNNFSKVATYNINSKISVALLYRSNKQVEKN